MFLLTIALVVAGCSVAPTTQQLATADYGAYPSGYREIADAWIKRSMKDPYSVRDVSVGAPEKFWVSDAPIEGGKKHYGYMVLVSLNGKNSFGAYTGTQSYRLLIHDSRVIAHQWLNQPGREVTGPDWVFQ